MPRTLLCRPFSPCLPRRPPPLLPAEPAGGVVVRIKSPLKKKSKKRKMFVPKKLLFDFHVNFSSPFYHSPRNSKIDIFSDQIQGGKDKRSSLCVTRHRAHPRTREAVLCQF
jgi:hypothetical protein